MHHTIYGVRACENAAKERRHITQDLLISLEKTTKTTKTTNPIT